MVRRGRGGEGQQLAACSMKGSDFPWKHPGSSCPPPLFSSGLFLMFLEQRIGKGSTLEHTGLTVQLGPKSPYPACHAHSTPLHSSDLKREPEFAERLLPTHGSALQRATVGSLLPGGGIGCSPGRRGPSLQAFQ